MKHCIASLYRFGRPLESLDECVDRYSRIAAVVVERVTQLACVYVQAAVGIRKDGSEDRSCPAGLRWMDKRIRKRKSGREQGGGESREGVSPNTRKRRRVTSLFHLSC
jgi:hypothetical protein